VSNNEIATFNDFEKKLVETGVFSNKESLSDESKMYLKEIYEKIVEASRNSGNELNALIEKVIDIYKDELNKPDISWEQKMEIFDRIEKQLDRKERDTKGERNFLLWAGYGLCVALAGAFVAPKVIEAFNDKNNI
jgi:alanyl-tRNA synthetase